LFGFGFKITFINLIFAALSILLLFSIIKKLDISKKIPIFSLVFLLSSTLFFYELVDPRPYLMANFFILMSINLFLNYLKNPGKRYLFLSALFLALSVYTQNLFIIGLLIPGFYFLISRLGSNKMKFLDIIYYYSFILLILSPWLIYRFIIAGFDFYRAPLTWMYQENYWSKLNIDLYSRPIPRSWEYYKYFINNIKFIFPLSFLLISLFSFFKKLDKYYLFILSWAAIFTLPIILGKIPAEERYLFPLLFPFLILIALGMHVIYKKYIIKLNKLTKITILIFVLILVMSNFIIISENIQTKMDKKEKDLLDLREFKEEIVPNKNIYFRSHLIAPIFPNNKVYSITDLELKDAIDLIGWESEKEVNMVMIKYNLKYLILYKSEYWEKDFHVWITMANGRTPKHYIKIENSNCFSKINESKDYKLYKFVC